MRPTWTPAALRSLVVDVIVRREPADQVDARRLLDRRPGARGPGRADYLAALRYLSDPAAQVDA